MLLRRVARGQGLAVEGFDRSRVLPAKGWGARGARTQRGSLREGWAAAGCWLRGVSLQRGGAGFGVWSSGVGVLGFGVRLLEFSLASRPQRQPQLLGDGVWGSDRGAFVRKEAGEGAAEGGGISPLMNISKKL